MHSLGFDGDKEWQVSPQNFIYIENFHIFLVLISGINIR